MSDPRVLLRQVHDELAAVEPQIRIIRPKGPDRRRLADAVEAAIGHSAAGDQAGCDAAIADLAGAHDLIAEFRNDDRHPNARAVARAADEALPELRAIRWHPVTTVSIAQGFDRVVLRPVDQVDKTVVVARSGDTGGVLAVGLAVTGLPPGVTATARPAGFLTGDRSAEATVVFQATRALGPGPHTARCALVPPPGVALGDRPSFDFRLEPAAWWKVPGGNRSGKLWNRGVSITGWAGPAWDTYESQVCKIDAIVGGSDRSGARIPDWAGLAGGPLDAADPASYDDPAKIAPNSQLDWDAGTNFGALIARSTAGKTWLVWVAVTIPTALAVHGAGSPTWRTLAQPGPHDDWWYAMGRRARAAMVAKGMEPWQLAVRFNHEMNQSNHYQVFDGQQADYAKASGRFMAAFRRGYAAAAGDQVRMIFSPARINDLGPLESFFTVNPDGTTPYDAVDVSAHPANEVNFAVGQTYAQQVQVCKDWLKGSYKSGYAPDNVDTTRSQVALAKKYGIAIVNTEWSPRYDEYNASGQETLVGCHISAAFYDAMHQHFTRYADMLAFECLFHGNALDPNQGTPGWADGVTKYKTLWRNDPPAGGSG